MLILFATNWEGQKHMEGPEYKIYCEFFFLSMSFFMFFGLVCYSFSFSQYAHLTVDTMIYALDSLPRIAMKVHLSFVCVMYISLSGFLAVYGWRLWGLVSQQKVRVPFLNGKAEIIGMTVLVTLIFTSRAIKDFLAVFELGVIPLVDPCTAPVKDQIISFVVSFIWDIVPASLLLFIFWNIPKPRETGGRNPKDMNIQDGPSYANPTLMTDDNLVYTSHLPIDNLKRYDSDEEDGEKPNVAQQQLFRQKTDLVYSNPNSHANTYASPNEQSWQVSSDPPQNPVVTINPAGASNTQAGGELDPSSSSIQLQNFMPLSSDATGLGYGGPVQIARRGVPTFSQFKGYDTRSPLLLSHSVGSSSPFNETM
eukprot:TRINITY_DN2533_c0_g1_i3.p1 TRINITY_DN2533_c0_g1~~TRINITY_DN2533_c0_g1_i3.p1  ORF type:complete len:366 (-),score=37.94 TRINITY_DN2533_c0_g1_i3:217-1314(-)